MCYNELMDILACGLASFTIVGIGCLMHFLYDICHENKAVAVFAAINESVWEHIKIGLTGFFVVTFVDFTMFGGMYNYWIAKAFSIGAFVILIPVMYYFIRSCMGRESVVAGVIEFLVGVFVSELIFMTILNGLKAQVWLFYVAFIILFVILGAYVMFTWVQPKLPIFMDIRNGKYGFDGHQKASKRKKSAPKKVKSIDEDEVGKELLEDEMVKKRIAAAQKKPTHKKSVPKMGRL